MTSTALVKSGLPPGPLAPAPIQTLRQLRDPYGFLLDCHRRYGDVFTVRLIPCGTMVYVADPAAVRSLFADPRLRGGSVNAYMAPLLGTNGLFTLDGDLHAAHRKLLAPLFATHALGAHEQMIADETVREIATWRGEIALRARLDRLALRVMRRILFGAQAADIEPLLSALKDRGTVEAATAIVAKRIGVRTRVVRLVDDIDRVVRAAIVAARHERRETGGAAFQPAHDSVDGATAAHDTADGDGRQPAGDTHRAGSSGRAPADVLGALVASGLSDEAIRDELMTLLFAGHETVATTLAWVFERAVRHPNVLGRLEDGAGDGYIDAVVKETMRQRSCLADVGRALAEGTAVGRWHLPAGTQVFPAIVPIHMRADLYPEPEMFRPERFLDGHARRPHPEPWAFLPFGGGARRCVGAALATLEMRVIVRTVFERLRVRAVSTAPERGTSNGMTIGPHDGARVRVEARA